MSARIFLFVVLLLAVLASAIGVVYARHERRQAFIALTALEKQRDELNIEFGRLQLEQATWSETNRLEQVASTRIGLVFPGSQDVVVLKP